MVFYPHQNAVAFRDFVAPHAHVHPVEVAQPCGLGDGKRVVQPPLVEAPVGVHPQKDKRLLVPKRHGIVLPTHPSVNQGGVPVRVPERQVERFVFMEVGACPELLVKVHRGGVASVFRTCGQAVHHPRAEPRLQDLSLEERREIFARRVLQQGLEIGNVHVAVKALGDDGLGCFTEEVVSKVRAQVVHDAGPLVVRVSSVNLRIGHG